MSIDYFTKQQFEEKLPAGYWQSLGLIQGEYAYLITINDDIGIMLRSSVKSDGHNADVGKDSIRAWLVDAEYKPLGSKTQKWVTRQNGWDTRLLDMLRQLWNMAQWAGYCTDCQQPMGVYVAKTKKNNGRIFKKCRVCGQHFEWMEE